MPNHWGTPLCYAARTDGDNEEIALFFLERVRILTWDCLGMYDACETEGYTKKSRVIELLLLREYEIQK